MDTIWSFAITSYLIAFGIQWRALYRQQIYQPGRAWFSFTLLACTSSAVLLHQWIDTPNGQNLSPSNVLSVAIWLSIVLMMLGSLRKPIQNLGLLLFPLAIFNLLYQQFFPNPATHINAVTYDQFFHVWLAILVLSILCLAAVQAIFVNLQDYLLKHAMSGLFIRWLPPLVTMESVLFQLIAIGYLLLTVLLITTFFFFHQQIWHWPLPRAVWLSLLSWGILAILLIGRRCYGWRGRAVMLWIMLGALVLLLSYVPTNF